MQELYLGYVEAIFELYLGYVRASGDTDELVVALLLLLLLLLLSLLLLLLSPTNSSLPCYVGRCDGCCRNRYNSRDNADGDACPLLFKLYLSYIYSLNIISA